MIVDNGDVITSGGATAFLNLVLYLVERFAGHDRANLAARVLLVDGHRPSQLPYIAFGRERAHDDVIVHQVQQHIDSHLGEPLRIAGLAASFGANRGWVPWLAKWHADGARIASSCTGAFLVADAGLLDGRPATTHWLFADELRRRYPAVRVTADQMIVDNGDVITSGGATAFLNLVLYLVERFAGHDRANLAARVLLVDGHRASQLPYIAFGRERAHDDVIVHQVQQHIDSHLGEPLRIAGLAASFGLSERTLSRRFAAATGRGPRAYIQHARVQYARRLLETAGDPVDQVRRRAGYSDPAAFRRVFKQATGLSPSGYRDAYGLRAD
jgi:transcriptional regulator GlxA family with amidase domain